MSVMSRLAAEIEQLIADGYANMEIALRVGMSVENIEQFRAEFVDDVDYYDDSMDGEHASALASAGWGTDEDYGYTEE
jgi:hypothetical protein